MANASVAVNVSINDPGMTMAPPGRPTGFKNRTTPRGAVYRATRIGAVFQIEADVPEWNAGPMLGTPREATWIPAGEIGTRRALPRK